jgi:hypothetical protein
MKKPLARAFPGVPGRSSGRPWAISVVTPGQQEINGARLVKGPVELEVKEIMYSISCRSLSRIRRFGKEWKRWY